MKIINIAEKAREVPSRMRLMLKAKADLAGDEDAIFTIPDGGTNVRTERKTMERQLEELEMLPVIHVGDVVRIAGRHWLGNKCDECGSTDHTLLVLLGESSRICPNCLQKAVTILRNA